MRKLAQISVVLGLSWLLIAAGAAQQPRSGAGRYDSQIQQELNKKLSDKDRLKNVRATVEDGIVTLEGNVELLAAKENADRIARSVDHVAGVRDLVTVAGKQVPDEELRSKLADKLRYDRVDRGIVFNNLQLGVNNGMVTLAGQVLNYADKASALAIVENTPGVKGVVDNVTVQPVSPYDDELRVRIARAIYGDPTLQRYAIDPQAPIRIVVQGGKVDLYGVVDNASDRQVAEIRARQVPGVFSVTNHLIAANQQLK